MQEKAVQVPDAAMERQQRQLEQQQYRARQQAALEQHAEQERAMAQACWQEGWLHFCWLRQEEEAELAARDAAAMAAAAAAQQQLLEEQQAEAAAAAAAAAVAATEAAAAELERRQRQAAAAAAEAAVRSRAAESDASAVSAPGKRQRVEAVVIDITTEEGAAPASRARPERPPAPAAVAAGRASGARPARARAPAAQPRAPAKPSAAKPPPRVRVQKQLAARRPHGRQALPSRADRAAWPAMRAAAVRAGLEFHACHSCGEPAYEGTFCGRGGGYCEYNDEMSADEE